jgi:hypothetical protein
MGTTLSDEDRVILRHLLTQVLGSVQGAVDLWTLVCIGRIPPDPRAFVLREAEILRSHIVVARTIVGRDRLADQGQHRLLESMYASSQELQDAFLILADFRRVSLEQVRSATETLSRVYTDLRKAVGDLAQSLNLSLASAARLTPEREEYYQRNLRGLFDQFRRERETAFLSTATASGDQPPP